MATASNRTPREVIEFAPNSPQTVALKFNQGKKLSNEFGDRMMFSLTDGRVMFLDVDVAAQIEAAGINVRENFTVTMRWDGQKRSPRTWEVARTTGEQPNGTFVVPAAPASTATPSNSPAASPKPMAAATAAVPDGTRSPLVQEADKLVDAYAEVLARALTKHEGRVKPDEVRALLITSYIQRNRLSSVA